MIADVFAGLASRATIHRLLKELYAKVLIEPVAESVSIKGKGKPAVVWALTGYRPRRNQIKHDVIVSLVILAMGLPARRGGAVDKKLDADIE